MSKQFDDHEEVKPKGRMDRRQFVKLSSLGMLTVGMLTGCSDDDNEAPIPLPEPEPPAPVPVSEAFFPQSVASGDPRPDSLVFWTRALNPDAPSADFNLTMELSLDSDFTAPLIQADFVTSADYDHCLKVKIMGLDPYTTYYYRFTTEASGSTTGTRVGRAKTAPQPNADVPVKFAYISCQDYTNRYYNTLAHMVAAQDDLDFVVHLGDYIYETTGDSTFQDTEGERVAIFSDESEAIPLGEGYAARGLSNYRDLYKIYRSDPMLQAVHERYPMIAIWDDHEFSDDSWGDRATYFDGKVDEQDTERKLNSERAYAEFMPLEFGLNADGQLAVGAESLYPNTQIYRDFRYGSHLHLLLTDTRTFRPDHVIKEDAWPGTVLVDQQTIEFAALAGGLDPQVLLDASFPYINIDVPQLAPYKQVLTGVLTQQYLAEGIDPAEAQARAVAAVQGNVATFVANLMIQAYNASMPPQPLPLIDETGLQRGLSVFMFGKSGVFANNGVGARYFVVKDTYDAYTQLQFAVTQGASEDIFGQTQEDWFRQTIAETDATWKVVGNSISSTSMVLDFRNIPNIPDTFRQRFYLNVDQFEGFPNKRAQLQAYYASLGISNIVYIAGDIHSSYAARHSSAVHEFTTAAVSSGTFKEFLRRAVQGPPFDTVQGASGLVENLEQLLLGASPVIDGATNEQQLKYTKTDVNGYAVIEINGDSLTNSFYHIDENEVKVPSYTDPNLANKFDIIRYRVQNGRMFQVN